MNTQRNNAKSKGSAMSSSSVFISSSVDPVGDIETDTVATMTSAESRDSRTTKTPHHPLEEFEDGDGAVTKTNPYSRTGCAPIRSQIIKFRSNRESPRSGYKGTNYQFPEEQDFESQIVTLKYELAQAKAEADKNRHMASKLASANKKLREEITESLVKEEEAVRQAKKLGNQVAQQKADSKRVNKKVSLLLSKLSNADSVADALEFSDTDSDLRPIVERMANLAERERVSETRRSVTECDHMRLFAQMVFSEKKKVTKERDELQQRLKKMKSIFAQNERVAKERDELQQRLNEMMSVQVVNRKQPPSRSLYGMMTKSKSTAVVTTMTDVPVESLLWSTSELCFDPKDRTGDSS